MNTDLVKEAYQEVDYFRKKILKAGGKISFCDLPFLEKDEIDETTLSASFIQGRAYTE